MRSASKWPTPDESLPERQQFRTVGRQVMEPTTRRKLVDGLGRIWRLTDEGKHRLSELASDDEVLAHMLKIHALLAGLFRDGEVEANWMYGPLDALDTNAPVFVLLSGREGALKVSALVERMSSPDYL
jgi:uncharacterized protein (DUF2384 family)